MMNDVQRPRPKTQLQLTSLSSLSHADLLTHRIVALLRWICDQGFPESRAKGTDLKRSCVIGSKSSRLSRVCCCSDWHQNEMFVLSLKSFMTDDRIGLSAVVPCEASTGAFPNAAA